MLDTKNEVLSLLEKGELERAGELLLPYLDEHEDDGQAWTLAGNFFTLCGDAKSAEEAFLIGVSRAADVWDSAMTLGGFYLRQNRRSDALTYFRLALESAPEEVKDHLRALLGDLGAGEPAGRKRERLHIYVRPGGEHFIQDLADQLERMYDVRLITTNDLGVVERSMPEADICWFEWCDELIVRASHFEAARRTRIVCRLHRYEAFTDMPRAVNWDRVDLLIVVADHLKAVLQGVVPGLARRVDIEVIPNGVDLERFPFRERRPGYRLAYVGYLHARKNAVMLLQVIAKLVSIDRRYELHVAGAFQDPLLQLYWNHFVRQKGLAEHVHFHGWQDDVAEWLDDKDYLLSTSLHESFGYAIAEAMAMGIKPVVHHFLYGLDVWPKEMLFNTLDEAVDMITTDAYRSDAYRCFIDEHYSRQAQVKRTLAVLASLPELRQHTPPDAPFEPGALRKLLEGVERNQAA